MRSREVFVDVLFIGRFQPFHHGHLWLLREAVKAANGDKVIVGIGSANVRDPEKNPLSLKQREEMLREVLRREKLQGKVAKMVGIDDFPSDRDWVAEIERKAGKFDVVVGNNEWTNEVLRQAGYGVVEAGYLRRNELEGTRIRKMIKEGNGDWVKRVPEYLVPMVTSFLATSNGSQGLQALRI